MNLRPLAFAALAAGSLLAGCATPPSSHETERAYRDVTFSAPGGKPLKLDLYVPSRNARPPLVVWIHGGGWRYGDKRIRFFVRDLTEQGIAVATIQYRLTWSAHWPAQRDDCLAAVRWLRLHAAEYGYDASRIGLGGDSAGGQLAALVGLLENRPGIDAVVALYPVTDCVDLGKMYLANKKNLLVRLFNGSFASTRAVAAEASPVNHVTGRAPAFLLIHGAEDQVVPIGQSRILSERLHQAGIESRLIVVSGQGHGFAPNQTLLDIIAAFYKKHLRP